MEQINNKVLGKRRANFELLRIVCMFMVLLLHTSPVFRDDFGMDNTLWAIKHQLCMVAVNCFVFISGYFSIKTSPSKVVAFLLIPLFYSFGYALVTLDTRLTHYLPISLWWFPIAYLQLMLVAPIINSWLDSSTRLRHQLTIFIIFILNFVFGFFLQNPIFLTGFGLPNFIAIYVLARYIHRYELGGG